MYKRICFIILLLFAIKASAQTFNHPYSYYGIGIQDEKPFANNLSMGGLSLAINDSLSFNPNNPASYSNIHFSTFDVGIKGRFYNLKQGDSSHTTNLFTLSYFSLGFPIMKKIGWGAAFGMLPVSRIGFNAEYETIQLPDSFTRVEGFDYVGGFNKFFIGTSVSPIKQFSFGANLYYLFGNTIINHSLIFQDTTDYIGIISVQTRYFGNIGFDFGTQLNFKLTDSSHLCIAATFSPSVKMNINQETTTSTFLSTASSIALKDTILKESINIGSFSYPFKYGIGATLKMKDKLMIGLDYNYENWSSFSMTDSSRKLNDIREICLGGELTPNRKGNNKYYKLMTYRVGIKYANSYLRVPKTLNQSNPELINLTKMSISFGAGFPIRRSLSVINTGIELGRIGMLKDDLIQENYINLFIGFRLNDLWFTKSKID